MLSKNTRLFTVAAVSGAFMLNTALVACSKLQSTEALVSEAKEYRQKGDITAAIIQLKNALQTNPDNAEARYLLGTLYNETGDPQSAEKELRKAAALGMSSADVLTSLGKALLMQGQYQKVLDETSRATTEVPGAELSTVRGNAYLALGKPLEAKDSFERALKDKQDYAGALIGLAKHALVVKAVDNASKYAEKAVTTNPNVPEAWFFKGDLLRAQGKVEPALAAYDEVLKLRPGDAGAHITKASLEIHTGKFNAAKVDIDAARKSAPGNLNVLYTQALYDFTQGKHAAALESLHQVLRAAPEHMPSVLLAGAIQIALGSTQQAEQHLKKYIEKNPQHPYASAMLASVLLKNGQTERALNIVNAALTIAPENPQLLASAGESYMKAKDYAKATKYFEKASTLTPQSAPLHTALGVSKLAQGDTNRGIAELEMATSLDAKSSKAGILLIMTHLRLKDYDKALAAMKAIEKEHSENPLVQNLKGGVYLAKKDTAAARESFEKAVALDPSYYPAAENLAKLDLLEKKPDAANKRFEVLLEKDKKNAKAMAALASIALSQGKKKEATDWLERAAKENPNDLQAAAPLAVHYLRSGEKQKALTLVQAFNVVEPSNPEVLDLLAQTQLANKDHAAALESYKKLAAIAPSSAIPQLRVATTYMAMQRFEFALDAVKKALSLQPDYLDAQLVQIQLEMRAGRHEQALAIARQIQKQRDKSLVGYVTEGDLLMAQNKPEVAVKVYEKALSLNKNGLVMVKVDQSLRKAGKDKEADARIAQWLKDHPNDTVTRMYIATESLYKKNTKAAIEQYQAILEKEPKNIAALNNLALAFQDEKDVRALEYAENAYALAPESANIIDTIGWILIEQGNTSRGLPLLQKAASLAPDSPKIRYHLAMGFVKSGDGAKARKELEQLIASGKPFAEMDEAKGVLKQLQ